MKQKYLKHIFIFFLIFIKTSTVSGQCNVTAPNDVTINCGASTTISATTTAVTYNLIPTTCTPVAITGTNAFPTTCDDCVTGQIAIGFPFNFYGNTYTTAVIQSNGILGFGPFTFTGFSSFAIPAMGNPNNYIAGFFADIDIRYGGTISYQTVGVAPNRRFVVSYNNVVPYNLGTSAGTGTASFQIVLNENGSFNVIISQLSANWNASTSGALATSGAENSTGTFAFPVPGRNATDWPGIVPAAQDCHLFNPVPCVFQRWQQGATTLTTNPNLTISPTSTTTYTAYWNCGGTICSDDTVVNVITPTITAGTTINNTNCATPNGSIPLNFGGFLPGTYTLNYLLNGNPQTQTITIGSTTTISQGSIFNTGSLSTTDLTWNRNTGGIVCNGSTGTTYYLDSVAFTPSISGSYTFNMCTPGTDWDGHASLYQNAFMNTNPCGTPGNFIIADDDGNTGGNCENDALLTATLTSGVTYYLVTTSFGTSTTGNYEWTYTGPVGATINTSIPNSFTISNINNGNFSNFTMGTGTCGTGTLAGPIIITSPSTLTTTGVTICPGASGTISASSACGTSGATISQGATFNSGSLASTDPTWTRNFTGTTCSATAAGSYYYDVASFTVSTAGSYTFSMCTPGTNWDGYGSLYQNAFFGTNPCGIPANHIYSDDDANTGGNCEDDALITATLSVGITYYLVTTSFSTNISGNYQWTFTGPASATINFGATGGTLQWYTTASGGTSISSASPFNPVGVAGSGLVNTNTPGTYTYYAACSTNPSCRTATNFIIGGKMWLGTTNNNWNTTSNWSGGTLPNGSDCVIIPITPNNPIVSGTNYNGLAGTLSVLNGATLTINSTNSVTVTDWVNVQATGSFIINNAASLVQINNTTNTGNITYRRTANNIRSLDYVYWSSPVSNYNLNNIISPLIPGPIWRWNPTIANTNGGQGNWEVASGDTMLPAKGYIVRGPSSFSPTVPAPLNGTFVGTPNNGIINYTISRGSDQNTAYHQGINGTEITNFSDNWNLLGNPYPSAIRGSQFLFNNNTKIEGNIKLWTHGTLPSIIASPFYNSYLYNYSPGDYLTYNFTGTSCCPAAASDLFIGAGQGFFVQMIDGPAGSDIVTFNNGLRSASYDNSLFYRMSTPLTQTNSTFDVNALERNRIWLDLISSNNQSDRTLFGYIEGATMGRDSFFDSQTLKTGSMSIYSLINSDKFLIQGRQLPFDVYDEVPIGVHIQNSGSYDIGIGGLDGIFTTQNIYLKDKELDIIHDLKVSPYRFSAQSGTINNRFKIVYLNGSLNNNDLSLNNNIAVITNENIVIRSSNEKLHSITVFDVLGRNLGVYKDINSNEFTIKNLLKNNTALFLQIKLENGVLKNEKIIF